MSTKKATRKRDIDNNSYHTYTIPSTLPYPAPSCSTGVVLLPVAIPVSYFLSIHFIPQGRTEQNRTSQTESLNLIKMKGKRKK